MDKKLLCPCGLTCCDCLYYKSEIYKVAEHLKMLVEKHKLDIFLKGCSNSKSWKAIGEHLGLNEAQSEEQLGKMFAIFEKMPEFMEVLDGIIKLQCKTTCQESGGCSIGGSKHVCKALKCVQLKNYEGCWQCDEIEKCDNLKFLKGSYGYVIEENLKTAREQGIGAVKSHGDKYYEWQRRG